MAPEKPRVTIVPHSNGSLTICCGDQCVEVPAQAAQAGGGDLGGGLTPPDAYTAAIDSLVILTGGDEHDRQALGLLPVDALKAEAFDRLLRSGDINELAGPRGIVDASSTRSDTLDMGDVGALVSSEPDLLVSGQPLRLAVLGGRIELHRLEPFMQAMEQQGQRLELHVLTGGEELS